MKTPADHINDYLAEWNLTKTAFARHVKIHIPKLTAILNSREDLTAAESTRIAKFMGMPAEKLMHKKINTAGVATFCWRGRKKHI
jgi:plasmid maintenance system antidote protein VapI